MGEIFKKVPFQIFLNDWIKHFNSKSKYRNNKEKRRTNHFHTFFSEFYENSITLYMYLPNMLIGSTMSVTNKSDTAKFPTKINSRDFLLIVWQTDTRIRRFPAVPTSAAIARIRTLVKAIPGASQTNWKRPNVFSSGSNGDPLLLFIPKILKFCWSIFSLRAQSTAG